MATSETAAKYKRGESDPEIGDVRSPAKNRYNGTQLHPGEDHGVRKGSHPHLFDKAAPSWWNPQFDSQQLERKFRHVYMFQALDRFRYAAGYVAVACIVWIIFFAILSRENWIYCLVAAIACFLLMLAFIAFSASKFYKRFYLQTSVIFSFVIIIFLLLNFIVVERDISPIGAFAGTIELLILIYTVIPLQLYVCVIIGILLSVLFEGISAYATGMNSLNFIVGRILLHLCIHLIGIHIFFMSQSRKRSTFLKVGQSIMQQKKLDKEKELKHQMIYSLMPKTVAEEVMKSRGDAGEEEEEMAGPARGPDQQVQGQMKFRTFHMSQMENVSILFADIVGFTRMSSNKTAVRLVELLNDLFGRFDVLCDKNGCEKISTLGDCYYCVSGCPQARKDHAQCCIEMGLAMCTAIQEFDSDHNEEVNMRVGVHTGTVLCGLVGTRRFKFDVWSNDVTLANMMESEGEPGEVHISESTKKFVEDLYELRDGEEVADIRQHKVLIEHYNEEEKRYQVKHIRADLTIKTYFIVKRLFKTDEPKGRLTNPPPGIVANSADVQIVVDEASDLPPSEDGATSPSSAKEADSTNPVTSHTEDGSTEPTKVDFKDGGKEGAVNGVSPAKNEQEENLIMQVEKLETQPEEPELGEYPDIYEHLKKRRINPWTLRFQADEEERAFHSHGLSSRAGKKWTLATPRISAVIDMAVSTLFFIMLSSAAFIGLPIRQPWIIFFAFVAFLELTMLLLLFVDICLVSSESVLDKIVIPLSTWIPRHIAGALLGSLPILAVFANFACSTFDERQGSWDVYYVMLAIVALLHFCNFTMLTSWMKSFLALITAIVILVLVCVGVCDENEMDMPYGITTTYVSTGDLEQSTISTNVTFPGPSLQLFSGKHPLRFEVVLDIVLLLLLIFFLNREFEINFRLNFYEDLQASQNRKKVKAEKLQADWLLHNIIPEYIEEDFNLEHQYSKNYSDVGVVFAKIVNYDEFYDESFEGGREYLRVLNELFADMEDLFDNPKYRDIEKIKTIGSCLMVASGLNHKTRHLNKHPKAHLYMLMEFCQELLSKLEDFNAEIFNFDFEMSIGFNTGEVTAGVIGTTKLLYDIWGDTVNISSRMYSTGKAGHIQVSEDVKNQLCDMFEFEYRGEIPVKGKGIMATYLLVKKKEGATWE